MQIAQSVAHKNSVSLGLKLEYSSLVCQGHTWLMMARKDITDSPARGFDIRSLIAKKGRLKEFYLEAYRKFLEVMNPAPGTGKHSLPVV